MSENLTPEVLADLKAKALKATPGEWLNSAEDIDCVPCIFTLDGDADDNGRMIVHRDDICEMADTSNCENNAAYIHAAQPYVVLSLLTALEEANSGLHGVMEAGRQEIALLRARAEKAETALAEARRQIAERDEALTEIASGKQTLTRCIITARKALLGPPPTGGAGKEEGSSRGSGNDQCGEQPEPAVGATAALAMLPMDDEDRPFSDSQLPRAMIYAGASVLERAYDDLAGHNGPDYPDWDYGMEAVAVWRAMSAAALASQHGGGDA